MGLTLEEFNKENNIIKDDEKLKKKKNTKNENETIQIENNPVYRKKIGTNTLNVITMQQKRESHEIHEIEIDNKSNAKGEKNKKPDKNVKFLEYVKTNTLTLIPAGRDESNITNSTCFELMYTPLKLFLKY